LSTRLTRTLSPWNSSILDGVITNGERYNKVIAIWSEVTDKVAKEMFKAMDDRDAPAVSSTRSSS
jgi:DNA-directed RNA polymerase subunit beta'